MALSEDKEALTAIVSKETAQKVADLAKEEKRSKASMAAILIEKGLEAFKK
ncbi:MAG: hypothetical protein WC343_13740 [Bacilli bacterium]